MMFKEVRTKEKITDKKEERKENKEFLEIKSESNITVEEAKDFWNEMFAG